MRSVSTDQGPRTVEVMQKLPCPARVLVQRDGGWHQGFLLAWRREGDDWLGFVRYRVAGEPPRLEWVSLDRIEHRTE